MKSSPTKQMTEKYTPAFPKAGKKVKPTKIWNKKVRVHDIDKPKNTHCRICGKPDDGSCYFHHPEAPYFKHMYGHGTALKVLDDLSVWAHHKCGTEASIVPDKDAPDIDHVAYERDWSRWIIAELLEKI